MSNALGVLILGGAAFYGWREGVLDQFIGADLTYDAVLGKINAPDDKAAPLPKIEPAPIVTPEPEPAPIAAPVSQTTEAAHLAEHMDFVQPFARSQIKLTEAIMWQESRGRINAVSGAGARGLMQVMPATATQMYNSGYTRLSPTNGNLLTAQGSIYFGTAYMEWLSGLQGSRPMSWLVRSYNGGPGDGRAGYPIPQTHRYADGGRLNDTGSAAETENDGYVAAVMARWNVLKGTT